MNFSSENLPKVQEAIYPIRLVSEETGVNSVTLRAWERRYGFIQPKRTAKGHRLYSRHDIERIKRVVELLEQGTSLSAIDAVLSDTLSITAAASAPEDPWQDYLDKMQAAITHFDEGRLDALYNQAMSLYPVHLVTVRLLLPLLKQLGDRWQQGTGTVAEEHFFGVYLRNKLGARLHHSNNPLQGSQLVAACMPSEYHDFGLLLFALIAREYGFRLVLLGANTPLGELVEVANRCGSDAIVLSATAKISLDAMKQLQLLADGATVPVMVGGAGIVGLETQLAEAGVIAVGHDLVEGVRRVRSELTRRRMEKE